MKHILSRDVNGKCDGECRDLVRESESKQQKKIDQHAYSGGHPMRDLPWASSRNESPGFLGGHV